MATIAARASKRDLAPDWRDALRDAVRRVFVRTAGILLIGVALAFALALASHSANDPSLSTAAGGPPSNWLGSVGAYGSDLLLLFFGLGSILFLPVIAVAGLRLIRLREPGRLGRGMLVAAGGAVLAGVALGLMSGSAVSGLPAGWGGALGLAGAHGVSAAIGLIPNPAIAGPVHLTVLLLFAIAALVLGYLAVGLVEEERGWFAGLAQRRPRRERAAAPRTTEIRDDRPAPAAPPK